MIQTNLGVAKPRNANVYMPASSRPKGWGRRNPHSSTYTRKFKGRHEQYDKTALAIEAGFNKISMLIIGRPAHEVAKPNKNNPFANVISKLIK